MSIKRDLVSGTIYIAIAKYSGLVISLIITAILSRLLTPEDYGLLAIAMVFIVFFNILSDIGIGPAIIQKKNLSKIDYNNIFSFTAYSGLALAVIFVFSAPIIAKYYDDHSLANICRLLSFVIFFSCMNIVPTNLLYKAKNFKVISFSNLIIQTILGIISIVAAFMGAGVYSLLIGPVFSPLLLLFVFNSYSRLKFTFSPQFKSIKKIWSFSIYQFLFNIVNYFSRNSDKLLAGKYIGLNALGYYEKSYRLMMLPLQNIAYIISPVLHPVFSELQNNYKGIGEKYCKVINFLAYIGFPLTAFLYFSAQQLTILIFGEQWYPAIEPFKILSLSVGIQIITSSTAPIFQAANATKQLFITGCIVSFIMVTGFIISTTIYKSTIALAYSFLITKVLDMIISYFSLFRMLDYPLSKVFYSLIKPLISGLFLFIILYFVSKYISNLNMILSLSFYIIITLIISTIIMQIMGEHNIITMCKSLINLNKHK